MFILYDKFLHNEVCEVKRKRSIAIITVVSIILIALSIKPILKYTSNIFWGLIRNQFDKEEAKRMEKIENREIIRGKDTILIWGNVYVIGHYSDGNHLSIETKDVNETILKKVVKYHEKKGKLYIVSDEGYAVIDKNNLCRVFITVANEEFVNGYTEDVEGNRTYISRKIESTNIEYLSEYEFFSAEEKDVFEKMLS